MDTWLPEQATGEYAMDRWFGLRPDLYEPFRAFYAVFWRDRLVDPVVLELCRLRVAQLLGCTSELEVRYLAAIDGGLDESLVDRLPRWPDGAESTEARSTEAGPGGATFTDAQRAALAFAEQFVIDPHGIRGPIRDTLRAHFDLPEVVALTEALALFDGFMRFRMVLGLDPEPGSRPGSGSHVIVDPTPYALTPARLAVQV